MKYLIGIPLSIIFLITFLQKIDNAAIGYYEIDIREWLYNIKETRLQYYIILTTVYIIIISVLWKKMLKNVKSIKMLFVFGTAGNIILWCNNTIYWMLLNKICFVDSDNTIFYICKNAFGSLREARQYYTCLNCELFTVAIIVNGMSYFLKNGIGREAVKLAFSGDDLYICIFCLTIVMGGIHASDYIVLRIGGKIIEYIVIPAYIGLNIIKFIKIYNYFKNIFINSRGKFVIVENNNAIHRCKLWSIAQKLQNKKIFLIPKSLSKNYIGKGISLELFDDCTEQKEHNNIYYFNIAYCAFKYIDLGGNNNYDAVTFTEKSTIKQIEYYSDYIYYRRFACEIAQRIKLDCNKWTNCIIEEIVKFQERICKEIDTFLVFDYIIKWTEIVNYIYALVVLHEKNVYVTNVKLDFADFKKWLDFREKNKDEMLKSQFPKHKIFNILNIVCDKIMKKKYLFKEYSLKEIFEILNTLRNYTRGHGVYTFEITQKLNLQLIAIVVFLINRLLELKKLDKSLDNLEDHGWVVYIGDIPYFLYSSENLEYVFNSFQKGNSVTLPMDYKGQHIENNIELE